MYDEEQPCSVTNPDGYTCPAGAATMQGTGVAYVVVGSWEDAGCTPEADVPVTLSVAINGVDVDLSSATVCHGDLLTIVP